MTHYEVTQRSPEGVNTQYTCTHHRLYHPTRSPIGIYVQLEIIVKNLKSVFCSKRKREDNVKRTFFFIPDSFVLIVLSCLAYYNL